MTALIIDTETDQGKDPRPIQVATIDLATGNEWMAYFNSGRPISPKTTAIHGIVDADVAGLERFNLANFTVPEYLIGHNVSFDWRVIGRPETKLICTVQLARAAFPDWYSYKQSHCIEQLFAWQGRAQQSVHFTSHAHDALGDVRMCREIYLACCERLSIEANDYTAAHKVSEETKRYRLKNRKAISERYKHAPITIMPFGKHRGQLIANLPIAYVRWVLANASELRPNLAAALNQRLRDVGKFD